MDGKTEAGGMRKVYKYPVGLRMAAAIEVPKGARFLCVQAQPVPIMTPGGLIGESPQAWFLVDPDEAETEVVRLLVVGTGHEIEIDPGEYLGSFQMEGGRLVFHVFRPCEKGGGSDG